MNQTLIISGRLPGMNEIITMLTGRQGRYVYNVRKKEIEGMICLLARKQGIKAVIGRYSVEFHWYEKNKRRDLDNICAAKKFILDGLVSAGILPQDSQKFLTGFRDYPYIDRVNPRIEVVIKEGGNA